MDPEKKENPQDKDRGNQQRPAMGSGLEAYALVSQLGLTITLPIVLGALAGRWIDEKLGTGIVFFLVLLCLGLAGGFAGAYRLIIAVGKKKNKK